MHRLLARQVRKHGGATWDTCSREQLEALLRAVDAAYVQHDDDRIMLERSLDLSSRELLQANADLRTLLESLPDLFLRILPDGTIVDVRGRPADAFFPGTFPLVGSRLQDHGPREVATAFATSIAVVCESTRQHVLEYQMAPEGSTRYFEARFTPIFDRQVIVIIRDITERTVAAQARQRRAEQLLRQQAALLELSTHPAEGGDAGYGRLCDVAARTAGVARASIWLFDQARRTVSCAWLHANGQGQPMPELSYIAASNVAFFGALRHTLTVAADDACHDPRTAAFAGPYFIPNEITSFLATVIRVEGEVAGIFCLEHVGPTRHWSLEDQDFATSLAHLVALALAASQRQALQSQLQHAQRLEALGVLAGGVAHDFNNLLTAILGFAELIRADAHVSPPVRAHVDEIRLAGERATHLTSQLLAFGRKQVRNPRVFDVNAAVHDLTRLLERVIGTGTYLTVHRSSEPLCVHADPHQLEQALLNLVVNARDAMPGGGTVGITVERVVADAAVAARHPGAREGRYVSVAVSDTGTGIDPEVLPRIFEPFFTTKGLGNGTGLGLAMVYGIVQQNGGYLDVSSSPGEGTEMRIALPEVGPIADRTRDSSPTATPRGGHESVLLVEDEEVVRLLTRQFLEMLGYRVLVASLPSEALELVRHQGTDIDLLLTDVMMPEMNGRELYRHAHAIRPGLRVMYMSGYSPSGVFREGVLEPGVAYLAKPFSLQQLAEQVRDAIEGPLVPPRPSGSAPVIP